MPDGPMLPILSAAVVFCDHPAASAAEQGKPWQRRRPGTSTARISRLVSSRILVPERQAEAKQLVEDHLEEIADAWHRHFPD
jgi:hypothetical protein